MTKFFTWSKGDRGGIVEENLQNGGVIEIPAQWLSPKGVTYTKNYNVTIPPILICKAHGVSLAPPNLTANRAEIGYEKQCLNPNSIALRDVAVESATNLLAVVNDILHSPHVSACANQTLAPTNGRPRSRTAPSTPMCDQVQMDIFELPAFPITHNQDRHKSRESLYPPLLPVTQTPKITANIGRPCSDPTKVANSAKTHYRHHSADSNACASPTHNIVDANQPTLSSTTAAKKAQSKERLSQLSRNTPRPSLSIIQSWPYPDLDSSSPVGTDRAAMSAANHNVQSHSGPTRPSKSLQIDSSCYKLDEGSIETKQDLTELLDSHDSYIASLNEAHDREVSSLRAFIKILEQKQSLPSNGRNSVNRMSQLRLDIPRPLSVRHDRDEGLSAASHQSFETALEDQKRLSQEAAAEVELLKRKISVFRRKEVVTDELSRERDELNHSLRLSENHLTQLRSILEESKEKETALVSSIENLEARLEASNNTRVDLLEGFHDAWDRLRRFHDRDLIMKQDMNRLRDQLAKASTGEVTAKLVTADGHISSLQQQLSSSPDPAGFAPLVTGLQEQLYKSQEEVETKDSRIAELESELEALRVQPKASEVPDTVPEHEAADLKGTDPEPSQSSPALTEIATSPLTDQLTQAFVHKLKLERDELSSLLHSELRRQARLATKNKASPQPPTHSPTSQITTHLYETSASTPPTYPLEFRAYAAPLEAEIQSFTKEIILYKLDIRGYKKDLRRLNARIAALEDASQAPPRYNEADVPLRLDSTLRHNLKKDIKPHLTGLGIHISNETTLSPRLTPSPARSDEKRKRIIGTTPSPARSEEKTKRTPPSTHKKLPRPPVLNHATSPPSISIKSSGTETPSRPQPTRTDTLRSLSESIINSYTRSSTPPQLMVAETVNVSGLVVKDLVRRERARGRSVGARNV